MSGERTPTQIMALRMSSIKTTDLVQTKPSAELYQTLTHEMLVVQRVRGLPSKTRLSPGRGRKKKKSRALILATPKTHSFIN